MIPGKDYSHDEIIAIAWRRKWAIVLPILVAVASAAVVASRLPDRFRAESLIMVVPQRIPEEYVRPTVTTKIEDRLQSIRQALLSRSTLESLIEEFDLYREERQHLVAEEVVARMRGDIDVQLDEGDAFRLTYESADPATAQKVAARLANRIIEGNAKDRQGLASDTNDFLEAELADADRRLAEQERTLAAFRREHVGELPEQLGSIIQTIQTRQLQLQSLGDSLARDRSERLLTERLRADLAAATIVDPATAGTVASGSADIAPLPLQLDAARTQLRRLELSRTPDHPDIRAAQRAIEALSRKVEEEAKLATGAKPPTAAELSRLNRLKELDAQVINLERQIAHKEASEKQIQQEVRSYQARAEAVPHRESQLTALTRGHAALQQSYQDLLKKKEESQIAENLERRRAGEQFNILDPAGFPERPYSPNRRLILLWGLVGGLAFGGGLVVFLEFRDVSLRTEADVRMVVSVPLLAAVPIILSTSEQTRGRRVRMAASLAAAAALVLGLALAIMLRGSV